MRFEPLEDRHLLATLTVNTLIDVNNGSDGLTTLREAISAAASGDTINFSVTGTINLTSTGSGHLAINKDLTIQGPGADQLTIRAFDPNPNEHNDFDGSHRVFSVTNNSSTLVNVTISGLTLTNGDPEEGDMDTNVGGAINNRENLTLIDCILTGNYSFNGGAIYSRSGNLQILDSTISGNTTEDGGALLLESATAMIVRSTLQNNTASNDGGGVKTRGASDLTIIDSTISGNMAGLYGGGVNNSGYLTVTGSTISGNSANASGGGIYSDTLDPVVVAYSTITGNAVGSGGHGGGIATPGDIEMNHSIVAGNIRGTSTRDDVSTEDSVEGGNPGSFAALYSLVGDKRSANVTNEGGSLIGTSSSPLDAMLGSLADNGGPTMTHALLAGSPAIDAGDLSAEAGMDDVPQFDQRGMPFDRVVDGDGAGGARIDMGAIELAPPGPALPGDYNLNGVVDAADYVVWRKALGSSVPQYSGADGDGDEMIGEGDYGVWRANFGNAPPPPGPELPGDYNLNSVVDAADYVLWRKALGSSVPQYSGADGDGNEVVDAEDYGVWRENFGNTLPPGAGSGPSVELAFSMSTAGPSASPDVETTTSEAQRTRLAVPVGLFDSRPEVRPASADAAPHSASAPDSTHQMLLAVELLYVVDGAQFLENDVGPDDASVTSEEFEIVDELFAKKSDELGPAWPGL